MRILQLQHVEPGMILGKPIYDSQGNVLLGSGLPLTDLYLERLAEMGISRVFIQEDLSEQLDVREVLPDLLRARTVVGFRKAFGAKGVHLPSANRLVDELVSEILAADFAIINLNNLKQATADRFQHSVDTCALGVAFGSRFGISGDRLKKFALGLLLHDIGLTVLPPGTLGKSEPLTGALESQYRQHPEIGWQMLREFDEVSPLTRAVILHHHERWDGSGYPHGLKGDKISEFGQIGGLIQAYDSLTSDRPHRQGLKAHEAIELFIGTADRQFNAELVRAFVRKVPAFPIGATVVLSTGDTAVVTDFHAELPLRPPVRLLDDGRLLDLAQEPSIVIDRIL